MGGCVIVGEGFCTGGCACDPDDDLGPVTGVLGRCGGVLLWFWFTFG